MKFLIIVSVLISSAFAAHIHTRCTVAHPPEDRTQWEQSKFAEKSNLVAHRTHHMTNAEAKSQFEQSNIAEKSPMTAHRSHPMSPNQEKTQWENPMHAENAVYAHQQKSDAEEKFEIEQSNYPVHADAARHQHHFKSDAARPNPVAEQEEFISMREAHPEQHQFEHHNPQESHIAEKRAMMMPAMNQARASMHRPRGHMRAINVPMY